MHYGKRLFGFDIGGVISRHPAIFRPLLRALVTSPECDVCIITDMGVEEARRQLAGNGFDFIPPESVYQADWATYGEAAKTVLFIQLGVDFFVDDYPGYIAEGCPVRLLLLPDFDFSYAADDWRSENSQTFCNSTQVAAFRSWKRTSSERSS
jgi:hypothetical protein